MTVWNEFVHEKKNGAVRKIYPDGMHMVIAKALSAESDMEVTTATFDEPEHGLPQTKVDATDVMIWWGHVAHEKVADEVVDRVHKRVLEGMGLIVLHSGHMSKIFRRLMGTSVALKWRESTDEERLWNIEPSHPITEGIGDYIEIPHEEIYGERFDIPSPDKVIFISWFEGGEVFRSGCCWERGHGRIFYFRPGHESYPTFYNSQVQKVIINAVRWAQPRIFKQHSCPKVEPLEKITFSTEEFGKDGVLQQI